MTPDVAGSAEGFRFAFPLSDGRELRLLRDGKSCALEAWRQYPGGHAMMGGGFTLGVQDLRMFLHAVRYALWDLERAEAAPPRGAGKAA